MFELKKFFAEYSPGYFSNFFEMTLLGYLLFFLAGFIILSSQKVKKTIFRFIDILVPDDTRINLIHHGSLYFFCLLFILRRFIPKEKAILIGGFTGGLLKTVVSGIPVLLFLFVAGFIVMILFSEINTKNSDFSKWRELFLFLFLSVVLFVVRSDTGIHLKVWLSIMFYVFIFPFVLCISSVFLLSACIGIFLKTIDRTDLSPYEAANLRLFTLFSAVVGIPGVLFSTFIIYFGA